MRWQLLCFDQIKDTQAQYSSDKLKSGVHDSMTYTDDVNRGIYGSSPNGGMAGEVRSNMSSSEVYMSREAVV
uniref:Uncharacterized protein n=1 Tax=Ditylenchus dipsaci TaxID=166011 RepID=A0A915EJM2_9BILA